MRPDMAKVVTERPRIGHAERSLKTAKRLGKGEFVAEYNVYQESHEANDDIDHGPRRIKTSRQGQCRERSMGSGDCHKMFSDLLGPLRGYLKKQVGRPWDDIYSELREHLDFRTVSGQHIWDHVKSEVALHCEERHGAVWVKAARFGAGRMIDGLYVHPRTGLLCYIPERPYRYTKPVDPNVVVLDKLTTLHRFDGIWYRVTLAPKDVWVPEVRYCEGKYVLRSGYFKEELVPQGKRQLGRKELRAHGLRNAAAA